MRFCKSLILGFNVFLWDGWGMFSFQFLVGEKLFLWVVEFIGERVSWGLVFRGRGLGFSWLEFFLSVIRKNCRFWLILEGVLDFEGKGQVIFILFYFLGFLMEQWFSFFWVGGLVVFFYLGLELRFFVGFERWEMWVISGLGGFKMFCFNY